MFFQLWLNYFVLLELYPNYKVFFFNDLIIMPQVEVLNLCCDFESRARAVLLLKFRAREAILSQAISHNIPDVGRTNRNLLNFGRGSQQIGGERRNIGRQQSKHRSSLRFFEKILSKLKLKNEQKNLLNKDLCSRKSKKPKHRSSRRFFFQAFR